MYCLFFTHIIYSKKRGALMDILDVLADDEVDVLTLSKNARIIVFSPKPTNSHIENMDFSEIINQIKSKITLFFNDKILYTSLNQEHYMLSLTSALVLDGVEQLKTPLKSKALKMIKKRIM